VNLNPNQNLTQTDENTINTATDGWGIDHPRNPYIRVEKTTIVKTKITRNDTETNITRTDEHIINSATDEFNQSEEVP